MLFKSCLRNSKLFFKRRNKMKPFFERPLKTHFQDYNANTKERHVSMILRMSHQLLKIEMYVVWRDNKFTWIISLKSIQFSKTKAWIIASCLRILFLFFFGQRYKWIITCPYCPRISHLVKMLHTLRPSSSNDLHIWNRLQ